MSFRNQPPQGIDDVEAAGKSRKNDAGAVLYRSVKRPKLTAPDRLLWAWLCGAWSDWRSALIIVKPETVIAWHRKGFRLFWRWKIRNGQPGRPGIPKDVRLLIRTMSRENPL
jgi:putative transposase